MRRVYRRSLAATAMLAALSLGLEVPSAPALATGSANAGCTATQHSALESAMRRAYDGIRALPSYTGIGLLSPCGPIDVFVQGGDPSAHKTILSAGLLAGEFQFHSVRNSLATLLGVQDRIADDFGALRDGGLDVYRFWPDMTTGLERIELVNATPMQIAQLGLRYGLNDVQVVSIHNAQPVTPTADDAHDTPAFSAGDFIENSSASTQEIGLGYCTSAFGVHTGSGVTATHYALTAGHCSTDQNNNPITNTAWINAYDSDANGDPGGGLLPIGSVTKNLLGTNHLDASYIQSSTSTLVWQGQPIMNVQNSQFPATTALVGQTVCFNGGYDGEQCSATVQSTMYLGCWNVSGFAMPFCKEIEASRSDGNVLLGEGGSGGPIYGLGPEQYAMGVQSLGIGSARSCNHFTYRGTVCFSVGTFVDLPSILGAGGGVVNVPGNP